MTDSQGPLLPLDVNLDMDGRSLVLEKRLAAGLTGEVFRGHLEEDGRHIPVAVKAMKTLAFSGARQFFDAEGVTLALMRGYEQEANAQQNVDLHIIPEYYGKGEYEGVPFLVMEFIEGKEIPEILHAKKRLPEIQALTVGWHLFRTLQIMHTRLYKSYIDLKFEDLWWVGDSESGYLKMTDFGTLEDIPADRQSIAAQHSTNRDVLLGGVFLLAMLTGTTINYAIGELRDKEGAEPYIKRSDYLSWGTRQLLYRLLHRNPQARLTNLDQIVADLRFLIDRWKTETAPLTQRAQRDLNRAAQDPASEKGVGRAREARIALGIAELREDAELQILEPLLEEADLILSKSDYLERGRPIFYGRSYSAARAVFEEGRDWSSDIAILSWWSYLARIGEEVPSDKFNNEKRAAAVEAVERMQAKNWQAALERLERLQPDLNSEGMALLQTHARFFQDFENANKLEGTTTYQDRAEAYKQALQTFESLPDEEQKVLFEEVGEIRPLYEKADELAKTRGQAAAKRGQAQAAMQDEQWDAALVLTREAITLDRYHENLPDFLLDAARRALNQGAYQAAADFAYSAWLLPNRDPEIWNLLTYADRLLTAQSAIPGCEQETYFDNLDKATAVYDRPGPIAVLIEQAATVAIAAGDIEFLRHLVEYSTPYLAADRVVDLRQQLEDLEARQQARQRQTIDQTVTRAFALMAIGEIGEQEDYREFYQELTLERYITYLFNRRTALQKGENALSKAATIVSVTDNYRGNQITEALERVTAELDELTTQISAQQAELAAEKATLLQRERELDARLAKIQSDETADAKAVAQLRQDQQDQLVACYRYLTRNDPDDLDIKELRDKTAEQLDWFGLRGWQQLQQTSTDHVHAIEGRLAIAQKAFESGDLAKATSLLAVLQEMHGAADADWQELVTNIEAAQRWEHWQISRKALLKSTAYEPAILAELRADWLPFVLPQASWQNSSAAVYIKQLHTAAQKFVKNNLQNVRHGNFIDGLKPWFDTEMTKRQAPGAVVADTMQQWPGLPRFLEAVVSAADKSFEHLQNLLHTTAAPPDVQATVEGMTIGAWTAAVSRPVPRPPQRRNLKWVYAALAGLILIILGGGGFALWSLSDGDPPSPFFPTAAEQEGTAMAIALLTTTATPVPTLTPWPTFTPTIMPTDTPLPPTDTPEPIPTDTVVPPPEPLPPGSSQFSKTDPAEIEIFNPPVPIPAEEYWLLPMNSAEANPPLADPNVWQTVTEEGVGDFQFLEGITQTVNISWTLDIPFNEGLYQLYVLDTIEKSGGTQRFDLFVDDQPVNPYRGVNEVIFQSPDVGGGQEKLAWLPIGAYAVTTGQELRIQTTVGPRDKPFAVPHLLIAPVGEQERAMLEALPNFDTDGRPLHSLLDDRLMDSYYWNNGTNWILGDPLIWQSFTQEDGMVWGNSFQAASLKELADFGRMTEWKAVGRLPAGQYELRAWMPTEHASAFVEYYLLIDGDAVPGQNPRTISQVDFGGTWETLGEWHIPEESNVGVRIVAMKDKQTPGFGEVEIGADAVVLLRVGD